MTADNRSSQSPDWEALARDLAGESAPGVSARLSPADREMLRAIEHLTADLKSDIPGDLDVEGALAKVKSRPEFRHRDVIPLHSRTSWRVPMPALAAAAFFAVGVA